MKNQKKQLTELSKGLLDRINQMLGDMNDDSIKGIEISGIKFSESTPQIQKFLCCRMVNGELVCKHQTKPCNQGPN